MNPAPGSQQNRNFTTKRLDGPRKVRHGMKLKGILDPVTADNKSKTDSLNVDLARRLLGLIEVRIAAPQLTAGLEYAKAGQIVNIEFQPGLIEARVQGAAPRPYTTQLRFPTLSSEQWTRVIEAMAAEAVHVAKLLANELPPTIDELLGSLNLSLLPMSSDHIAMQCTCAFGASRPVEAGDDAQVARGATNELKPSRCKHVAAASQLAAERLAEVPLLSFTLLGMPVEQLLEQLRHVRAIQMHGAARAHTDALIPESQLQTQPLEACIDEFWRSPLRHAEWEELESRTPSHHVPHALLRRLGPSSMNGRFPMVGLLASVYDTVAASAAKLRELADEGDGALGDERERVNE